MSRSFSLSVSAGILVALAVAFSADARAQQAAAPASAAAQSSASVSAATVTKMTAIPDSYDAASTQAVPPPAKQNAMERSINSINKRFKWNQWADSTPAIKSFLSLRDPNTAATLKPDDYMTYFTAQDVDNDGVLDLIVRFGSGDTCAVAPNGCPYAVYFGDVKKARTVFNARKLVPVKGGMMIHNRYYALNLHGGETFDAISYRSFHTDNPFDTTALDIMEALKKVFPSWYDAQERPPGFRYTLFDLNQDGQDEILLTIMEDDDEWEAFCDSFDGQNCPVLVYSTVATPSDKNAPGKLLGFFRSRQDLLIARSKGKGYADIITTATDKDNLNLRTYAYSMNSKTGQYVRN